MFSAFSNPNVASSNPPIPPSSNFGYPPNPTQSQTQTQTQVQNPAPIANAFAAPNPYVTQNQPATTIIPTNNTSNGFRAAATASSPGPTFSFASSPQPNGQTPDGAQSFTSNQATTANPPASIFQANPWPQQQQGSDEPSKFKFPRLAHNANASSTLSTISNQRTSTQSSSIFDSQANHAQGSGGGSPVFNFANGGNNIPSTSIGTSSGSVLSGLSQKPKTPFAFDFQKSQDPTATPTFPGQSEYQATSFDSDNTTMDESSNPFVVETELQMTINPSVFANPSQSSNNFGGFSNSPAPSGGFPTFSAAASKPSAIQNGSSTATPSSIFSAQTLSDSQQNSRAFSAFAPQSAANPPSAFTSQTSSDNMSSAFSKPNAWNAPSVFPAPTTSQQPTSFPNAFSTQTTNNGSSAFTGAAAINHGKPGRQPSPRLQKRKYDESPSFPTGAGGTAHSSYEDSWLTQVATCLEGKLGDGLAYLMSVGDKIDPEIEGLRGEMLRGALERDMDAKIDQKLGEDWKGFNVMVFAYLQYLRDLNDKLDMRFKATLRFADKLASAYGHPEGKLLNALARRVTTYLSKLALFIDQSRNDPRWTKTELAHAVFRKIFNASIGERTRDGLGKKELTLHFANILFKIYFKMGQTNMLQTMHNNIKSALRKEMIPSMARELKKHHKQVDNPIESELWPKSERCTYAYYYGRTHFIYGRIKEARNALQEAYELAPVKAYSQRRLILVYLVSSNVILGNFPSKELYKRPEAVGFEDVFSGIVRALKLGHFRLFEEEIFKSRSWLVHWHVFFELRNRCQPLLWRSLVKNTWQYNVNNGGTANKTARVAIQHILMSASAFHHGVENWPLRETEITKEHVEAALLSLLDQGLLDGYVSQPGGQTLSAFSKSRALFPKLRVLFDPVFKYHS